MKVWTAPEFTKRNRGFMGIMGSIATWLAVAFAIVGIISEATLHLIGLYPTSWYLLAIASLIFSLCCRLGWAVGIYLHAKEKETEGKDKGIPISQS
jgi:ABC-type multidrug transport system permease subunit